MAKRQPTGGGRKAPEPDYQKEMRRAFESSNRENRPSDNRSLIPQLMRELVEVHGYRRGPLQHQLPRQHYHQQHQQHQQHQHHVQDEASARYRRRIPVPARVPTVPAQMAQPSTSSQGGQRAAASGTKWREYLGTHRPKAKDAENKEHPRQLSPDEQFELDLMLAIERSLEECFTPAAKPFPDVQVPEKDEAIPVGEMTVKAEVHHGGTIGKKFVSGDQRSSKLPDHRATGRQSPAEPLYAEPVKKNDRAATQIGRAESPTPSSDSSGDRPPTPHPRSWLPITMKQLGGNSSQNIHQQQEFEEKRHHGLQSMLTNEQQYQLDTQLAIQHSLQEAFAHSSGRPTEGNETVMMATQDKRVNDYKLGISETDLPHPTNINVITPAGMNAQYVGSDGAVMVTNNREAVTNNVSGTVCNSPPKPARLYVRGVNAPPGMMEPIPTVVQRVSNVLCPPHDPNDEGWENIIPSASDGPQQDLTTQQQPITCWTSFTESFRQGINAVGHHLRMLATYTWHYLCRCQPIPGTCAHN